MPLREFKCKHGHITEKVLFGLADETTNAIRCEHVVKVEIWAGDPDDPSLGYDEEVPIHCGAYAPRVEVSQTGSPQFVEGSGGFYKPTPGAIPSNHNTSSVRDFVKEHKIAKKIAPTAKRQMKGDGLL